MGGGGGGGGGSSPILQIHIQMVEWIYHSCCCEILYVLSLYSK